MNTRYAYGLTLVELLVVMAILGMLLTMVPSGYAAFLEKQRLEAAAEAVRTHLQLARSEAIRQMRAVTVTHPSGASSNWQLGMNDDGICDPSLTDANATDACSLKMEGQRTLMVLNGHDFSGVSTMTTRTATRFDPLNGTSFGSNATVRLTTDSSREVRIVIANIGRIRTCSPAGTAYVSGYPPC